MGTEEELNRRMWAIEKKLRIASHVIETAEIVVQFMADHPAISLNPLINERWAELRIIEAEVMP